MLLMCSHSCTNSNAFCPTSGLNAELYDPGSRKWRDLLHSKNHSESLEVPMQITSVDDLSILSILSTSSEEIINLMPVLKGAGFINPTYQGRVDI